jgi:hypothetical protein
VTHVRHRYTSTCPDSDPVFPTCHSSYFTGIKKNIFWTSSATKRSKSFGSLSDCTLYYTVLGTKSNTSRELGCKWFNYSLLLQYRSISCFAPLYRILVRCTPPYTKYLALCRKVLHASYSYWHPEYKYVKLIANLAFATLLLKTPFGLRLCVVVRGCH